MGLGMFRGSKCRIDEPVDSAPPGNPNPRRFTIVRAAQHGRLTAVEVHYPDATTYEGRKLMVFRASESEIRNAKELDPHFCDGHHLSPLARFRPDQAGWGLAMEFLMQHGGDE